MCVNRASRGSGRQRPRTGGSFHTKKYPRSLIPARRLYTACRSRGTNSCCTLRPPRLSCKRVVAVSVGPSVNTGRGEGPLISNYFRFFEVQPAVNGTRITNGTEIRFRFSPWWRWLSMLGLSPVLLLFFTAVLLVDLWNHGRGLGAHQSRVESRAKACSVCHTRSLSRVRWAHCRPGSLGQQQAAGTPSGQFAAAPRKGQVGSPDAARNRGRSRIAHCGRASGKERQTCP